MKSFKHWLVVVVASLASVSVMVAAGAQDATESETDPRDNLSAAIHSGTCDDFSADPVYTLGDVAATSDMAEMVDPDVELMGFQDVDDVLMSETNLETGISALFQQEQVLSLVVQDSEAADGSYVVCGELGGYMVNGLIAVGLTAADSEGDSDGAGVGVVEGDEIVGVAIFGAGSTDQGDVETLTPVRVYVFVPDVDDSATPAATNDDTTDTVVQPPVQEPAAPIGDPPGTPTTEPTVEATVEPTGEATEEPTDEPTTEPTDEPTIAPTVAPTEPPTIAPTVAPTDAPTAESTEED